MKRLLFVLCLILACSGSVIASNSSDFGHLTYMDPNYGPRDIIYEKIDGFGIVEGDIILTKLDKSYITPKAMIVQKISGERWEGGVLPFKISESFPLSCRHSIFAAMSVWEKYTKLKFVELTANNSDSYPDYLHFLPSSGNTSSSDIGRQGGGQTVNISLKCKTMSVAHEIGHSLGLWHEQSRADRDQYIKIIWDNIEEKHQFNFNQHFNEGFDFGEYDYQSIMHYSSHAFSKNGLQTIVPLFDDVEIGQRKELSKKDIVAVNSIYP
ncbi:MAG: M12 family metallopeptidase [Legionellaceae bacterium]|nr:M12 family metallopeptidase [Legionellaceae bacterium]